MPAFEAKTVNSILEDTDDTTQPGSEIRSIHPITGENYTPQTYELLDILNRVDADTAGTREILSPREVSRQASALAGLPENISQYMENYLELSREHAAFHGHHN